MFDALYQLALAESGEASVDAIVDGAFNGGKPVACSCFETGERWPYVWTRDTAYASDLGLAWVDPARARTSLEFKTSPRRDGSDLQIVQDTGTGGSYPVSTDRVVWALGARAVFLQLAGAERAAFRDRALEAIVGTLRQDRALAYDPIDRLYRGEQSFLDWRSQTYPEWTVPDTVHIAMSKSLGTNVAHLAAMEIAAELADDKGDLPLAATLRGDAAALRERIRTRFWLDGDRMLSAFVPTELDPAPARRFDLLGTSLAVLFDVATPEQARAAIARYPVLPKGPPVVFPQEPSVAIYHNRAIWPFVTAYWAKAARKAGNAEAVAAATRSLMRGAALNLSNVENLELVTGRPWVDDGALSGPVVSSQRQLWSVAGYLGMVNDVLFGLQPTREGLRVAPFLPRALRAALFGATHTLVLNDVRVRDRKVSVVLRLPPAESGATGAYAVAGLTLNGLPVSGDLVLDRDLMDRNLVEVTLTDVGAAPGDGITVLGDTSSSRSLFAPRTPAITQVELRQGKIAVGIDARGEAPDAVVFDVYRDGAKVASELPGTTTVFVDPATSGDLSKSHCYSVEARYLASRNASHRARPACFWGSDSGRILSLGGDSFQVTGGTKSSAGGRTYHAGWGDPDHTITTTFTARRSGAHLVEAVYANGAGGVDTGVSCAVKRVDVIDVATGAVSGGGYLVMPQRGSWGDWGDSSFVRASLAAGRSYRVVVRTDAASMNMSELAHFGAYTGGTGGAGGPMRHVDISEIKVLSLE